MIVPLTKVAAVEVGKKKKSSDSGYILKEETIGFPEGLDVGCERKRINKDYSKVLVEKNEVKLFWFYKDYK